MSAHPQTPASVPNQQLGADNAMAAKPKRGIPRAQKIFFFATGWLIVLMPFLFWWNTWFGRHLSD